MSASKKNKNETVGMIDIMIEHADKGPSGFWVEDRSEGCGNPEIFPEFEEGLKHGRSVYKNHYYCPWNRAIFEGTKRGEIPTGCYHHCSINEAKYLSEELLKKVLQRFKERLIAGQYDNPGCIEPLLNEDESEYIRKQMESERREQERREKIAKQNRIIKASKLIKKYSGNRYVLGFIENYYGEDIDIEAEKLSVNFSPSSKNDVVGGEKLTYDDYIDVQIKSFGKQRTWFKQCYYGMIMECNGCIEKISNNKICFKRISVSGMYPDGRFFDGKEDHVWMDIKGFESFGVGDCVSFYPDVYRYIKTGNGKLLDYGLRNPEGIKKIDSYELPSDDDLLRQSIDEIIYEECYLPEQCGGFCIYNEDELGELRQSMFDTAKSVCVSDDGEDEGE